MLNKKEEQKNIFTAGFTMIEVIIVISILSIIAAMSIISWQSFSDATNLGNTAKIIETKLRVAKSESLSALNNINYGVHFEANSVTIFPADAAYSFGDSDNQVFALTNGIEVYGPAVGTDIIFSRLTGVANSAADIDIRIIQRPSKTKTISVNLQGQTGTGDFEISSYAPILEYPAGGINSRHIHYDLSAWSIQSKPPVTDLIFRKADGTLIQDIDTASYFSGGIFNWQGSITVDGEVQKLRIHTLDAGGSTLCIMRDRMENNKTIKISFMDGGIAKEVAVYREEIDGTVSVVPNFTYVNNPIEAQ